MMKDGDLSNSTDAAQFAKSGGENPESLKAAPLTVRAHLVMRYVCPKCSSGYVMPKVSDPKYLRVGCLACGQPLLLIAPQ